jgi:hypothetical protein
LRLFRRYEASFGDLCGEKKVERLRWRGVELLLHDNTINTHSCGAGLFMLLFAQPLNQILKMTHDQIADHGNGRVIVAFDTEPIQLPRASPNSSSTTSSGTVVRPTASGTLAGCFPDVFPADRW